MNSFFGEKPVSDKNHIVASVAANDDHNLVVRLNIHNGHKMYEVNLKEGVLDEVKYESKNVYYHTKLEEYVYRKQKYCIYFPALNEKNALRKLIKIQAKRGITVKEEV